MDNDAKTLREQEQMRELLKKMFAGGSCSSCGGCTSCGGGDMKEIKEELQPKEAKKAAPTKKKS
jgi:hypothetical protein